MGRALTASEIKEVNAALTSGKEQIEDANATLVKNIASAFGLSQDQVKEALKKRAALVQTLAEMVGRKLTATEIQALRVAMNARRDALKTIHDELAVTLASATGLTPEEAGEALRPPPPPKPGDKPADKPADKT